MAEIATPRVRGGCSGYTVLPRSTSCIAGLELSEDECELAADGLRPSWVNNAGHVKVLDYSRPPGCIVKAYDTTGRWTSAFNTVSSGFSLYNEYQKWASICKKGEGASRSPIYTFTDRAPCLPSRSQPASRRIQTDAQSSLRHAWHGYKSSTRPTCKCSTETMSRSCRMRRSQVSHYAECTHAVSPITTVAVCAVGA